MMEHSTLDTSPVILQDDTRLWPDGSTRALSGACITKIYDLYVGQNDRTFDHYGLTNSTINYNNGEFYDYWNSPSETAPATSRTLAKTGTTEMQFTLMMDKLDDCYVIQLSTGIIVFAGKNSIYYGHRNISELN